VRPGASANLCISIEEWRAAVGAATGTDYGEAFMTKRLLTNELQPMIGAPHEG